MIKLKRPPCPNPTALSTDYKHKENKLALHQSTNGKCMYCESCITHIDFAHVEHIKPKAIGKYPELEFEWTNLGYACPKCNNAKSDKYDEATPYIDPYSEEPSAFIFFFGAFIYPKKGSERGELTILDLELNRSDLVARRNLKTNEILRSIRSISGTQNPTLKEKAIELLNEATKSDKEYSSMVKDLLEKALT